MIKIYKKIKNLLKICVKYINEKIFIPVKGKILWVHYKLLSTNWYDETEPPFLNIYQGFISWLLDTLQYTIVAVIIIACVLRYKLYGIGLAFGLFRWLIFDTIKKIRKL